MLNLKVVVLSLATVCGSALMSGNAIGQTGRPGLLSDVEGQASIEGRALSMRSSGTVSLGAGHVLATANGKAEVLLTPGSFIRIGGESTLEMVSPDPLHSEVRLTRGRADVEVNQIAPEDRVLVDLPGGQTQLLERGLYSFDADTGLVRVFDGKAAVYPGADLSTDVHPIDVKGGRELSLSATGATPRKFDKDKAEGDDLYRWGSMRSRYLGAEYEGSSGYYPEYPAYYPGYYPGYWYGGWPYYGYGFYGGGFYYGGWGRGFYGGGWRGGGWGGGWHGGGRR